MKPVVLEGKRSSSRVPDEQTAWAMGFLCGLTVAAVGALDNALLFYPPQFASLDWEFGTISGLIEGMPLMTIGFGAMVVTSAAMGWKKWRRALSIMSLLIALVLLALLVIFALDVPAAFSAVQPAMQTSIKKLVLKNAVMGSCYLLFYVALGVWTWRRLKTLRGAS